MTSRAARFFGSRWTLIVTQMVLVLAVVYCLTVVTDAEHRTERAHNELCLSHRSLIKTTGALAAVVLAPLAPVANATPGQLAQNVNANAQKAARLKAFGKQLEAAKPCPHV